jgi:hypothetical protein
MTAILYPVATDAEAALAHPVGRAARAREAAGLAGEAVVFATEAVGPAYATRGAALDAHGARVEDERPGGRSPAPEDRYCRLAETVEGVAPKPMKPSFQDGRRWPAPPAAAPRTVWRLQVSYWRPVSATAAADSAQARKARRGAGAAPDSQALRNLTRQPLRPVRPQQPLDIGLFEVRLPENPNIVMPDE